MSVASNVDLYDVCIVETGAEAVAIGGGASDSSLSAKTDKVGEMLGSTIGATL